MSHLVVDSILVRRLLRIVAALWCGAAIGLLACSEPAKAEPSPEYKAAAAEYKRLCAMNAECTEKMEAKREKAAQRRLARKLAEIQALKASTH